jgi:hypothetical protein
VARDFGQCAAIDLPRRRHRQAIDVTDWRVVVGAKARDE